MKEEIPQICFCCRWWKQDRPTNKVSEKRQFGDCHVWPFVVSDKHLMDGCSLWQVGKDATPQSPDIMPQWQGVDE